MIQTALPNIIYKQSFSIKSRRINQIKHLLTPEDFLLVLFVGENGSMDIDFLNKGTLFARGGKGDFRDSFSDAMII